MISDQLQDLELAYIILQSVDCNIGAPKDEDINYGYYDHIKPALGTPGPGPVLGMVRPEASNVLTWSGLGLENDQGWNSYRCSPRVRGTWMQLSSEVDSSHLHYGFMATVISDQ